MREKGLKYKLVDGVLDLDLLLPPTLKNNDRLMFFQKQEIFTLS